LVLAVERSAEAILQWSGWRRWHQAWARYHHYQRRRVVAALPPSSPAAEPQVDVIDVVWQRLEGLLPVEQRTGRPYDHDRRVILEAIVYVMQTDCGWAALPSRFPPWKTVYWQFSQWRKTGIWDQIWAGLIKPVAAD